MNAGSCAMCGAERQPLRDNDPYAQVAYYEGLCRGCSRRVSDPRSRNLVKIDPDGERDLLALERVHPNSAIRGVDVVVGAEQARAQA